MSLSSGTFRFVAIGLMTTLVTRVKARNHKKPLICAFMLFAPKVEGKTDKFGKSDNISGGQKQ